MATISVFWYFKSFGWSFAVTMINVLCPLYVVFVFFLALYCESNFPSRDNKDLNWTGPLQDPCKSKEFVHIKQV